MNGNKHVWFPLAVLLALLAGLPAIGCDGDEDGVTYTLPPTTRHITAENSGSLLALEEDGARVVLAAD